MTGGGHFLLDLTYIFTDIVKSSLSSSTPFHQTLVSTNYYD